MKDYFKFWGKTDNEGNWHPLVCHMLDVAAVGKVWLENDPALLSLLKENMGIEQHSNNEDLTRILAFALAFHDIGKATICFQNKIPEFAQNAGFYDRNRTKISFDHGLYGLYWLSQYEKAKRTKSDPVVDEYYNTIGSFGAVLRNLENKKLSVLFVTLLKSSCWHHGTIYSSIQINNGFQCESDRAEVYPLVNSMRNDLLTGISDFFNITNLEINVSEKNNPALTRLFAGFVSVCDWIASSDEVFSSNFSLDLEEHYKRSSDKGLIALKKYGLVAQPFYDSCLNFLDFFGFSPRGVQSKIEEILQNKPASFFIIEAPTGEGKSEAAFYTHYKLPNKGLYFALPSQATANQMYGRVTSFLEKQLNIKTVTVLAHGFAWLSEQYKTHKQKVKEWDEASGYSSHDEWFFTKKKTLLATTGVGTVDQVMLSVLNTKHYFVKLFALAGKTLIIDEVHAYDYFMLPIIKQLLEWCSFLKINVVLLSATLPEVMKKELVQGYLGKATDESFISDKGYPLITTVSSEKYVEQHPVDTTRKSEKIGIILKKHSGDVTAIVADVLSKIINGGNVLWICNTVKRSQEIFDLLDNLDEKDYDLYLFHSRFTYNDRIDKEATVTNLYGKGDDNNKPNIRRPSKSILVATQVVEQSLDVDFDIIVSDIAPVDLLLQRFGRMHRHDKNNRSRPESVNMPHAYILIPDNKIEGPVKAKDWRIPKDLKGFAEVYDPLTIYKTIKVLSENTIIELPKMYRSLVEDVYAENTDFENYDDSVNGISIEKAVWDNSYQYYQDNKADMLKASKGFITPRASKDVFRAADLTPTGNEEDTNAKSFIAKTRYGNELNISFVVSHIVDGALLIGKRKVIYQSDFSDCVDVHLQQAIVENSVKAASPMNFILEVIKGEVSLLGEDNIRWIDFQKEINKIPALRDNYMLILDSNNTVETDNYIIRYEHLYGLSITKREVE
ncbi:MAG: CRISPR-associated helicase Cas3' [Spirochaetes bacterium]|nr:CRISPR-associated helicase Cas3' [Spirochaetota bacterium]MBN2770114.1 CRISPR-associated helicase Cas3' [Spirochaetota bacterium]